jgi:uncharacterized protein GlcG (DUF336 family)
MPYKIMLAAGGLVLLQATANAQVIMERNVSMAMARAIVDGAVEQCQKDGHRVVVVVVDRAGQMVAMQRDDGTNPHNFELARRKAYTSRTFRQTSAEFFQRTEKQPSTGLRNLPDVIWTGGGGAPIWRQRRARRQRRHRLRGRGHCPDRRPVEVNRRRYLPAHAARGCGPRITTIEIARRVRSARVKPDQQLVPRRQLHPYGM